MVPKIANFYWGEKKLPYMRYLTIFSFIKYNPEWEVRLYIPKNNTEQKTWVSNEQKYEVIAPDFYFQLKQLPINIIEVDFQTLGLSNGLSEVYKSDFLRWHLLSKDGGLWSDMDILFFKKMPDINIDTGVCIGHYGHSIGFLLSSRDNKFFKYIFDRAKIEFSDKNYQSIGSVLLNKYFRDMNSIHNKYPDLKGCNIPMDIVYAYHAGFIEHIFNNEDDSRFTDKSIGIHWYAGHKMAGDFINGNNQKCLLSNICEKEGYDLTKRKIV